MAKSIVPQLESLISNNPILNTYKYKREGKNLGFYKIANMSIYIIHGIASMEGHAFQNVIAKEEISIYMAKNEK